MVHPNIMPEVLVVSSNYSGANNLTPWTATIQPTHSYPQYRLPGNSSGLSFLCLAISVLCAVVPLSLIVGRITGSTISGIGTLRPTFYFCATTHARFTPTLHRFRYPILYVGFPITMAGATGCLFGIKSAKKPIPWTFFSVDPQRYLYPELSFEEKMHKILTENGLDATEFPHIYFVTTPAFMGYSFNPVSYYYLYSATYELKAMILEVKNTFSEHHLYLLNSSVPPNLAPRSGYDFVGTMEKIFHISPFNHRSGRYDVQVRDLLRTGCIDVNLSVFNAEGRKAMAARAFSDPRERSSLDLEMGTALEGWYVVLAWGWNNFIAVAATFYEALRIYRKGVAVYARPEPLEGSFRRGATSWEKKAEGMALEVLEDRVKSIRGLEVRVSLEKMSMVFSNCVGGEEGRVLHIRVVHPRFFLRLIGSQDPAQALWLDYVSRAKEFHSVVFEEGDVGILQELLTSRKRVHPVNPGISAWGIILRLRKWKTRRELAAVDNVPTLQGEGYENSFDGFLLPRGRGYQWTVLHAVIADLIGYGDSDTLGLYFSFLAIGLLFCSVAVAMGLWTCSAVTGGAPPLFGMDSVSLSI